MPRPKRHDLPGHLYHVMNRGSMKRPIFMDEGHRRFFLARMAEQVRAKRIRIFSYCNMDTHFHSLIESVDGDMQGAMQRVESRYCATFNRRNDRRGGLVEGRYLSVPIESTAHLLTCVGYIDLNPVAAGICKRATDYPHSSASTLASGRRVPKWLDRSIVDQFLQSRSVGRERFEHYERVFHDHSEGGVKLAEARLEASQSKDDGLSLLLWGSDARRREWLMRRAIEADGFVATAPVADSASVLAAIEYEKSDVGISRGRTSAKQVAEVALLRELCGLAHARSGVLLGVSQSTVWSRYKKHVGEVAVSPRYVEFVMRAASRALRFCYGDGLGMEAARRLAEAEFIGRRRRRAEAAIVSAAEASKEPPNS